MLLNLVDILLHMAHLSLMGFNLMGWIWPGTRRLHIVSLGLLGISWFGLGMVYGLGYCPLTDWQWSIKRMLGESDLPASYVTYLGKHILNLPINDQHADVIVATSTAFALSMSILMQVKSKMPGNAPQ